MVSGNTILSGIARHHRMVSFNTVNLSGYDRKFVWLWGRKPAPVLGLRASKRLKSSKILKNL